MLAVDMKVAVVKVLVAVLWMEAVTVINIVTRMMTVVRTLK